MKYVHVYALFLMLVFCNSCGQNQTKGKKIIINSETEGVIAPHGPQSITRNVIQDRKGNIWIAAFDGIFRYDGKFFTNITSKVTSVRFFSVLEDRKGNFWFGSIGSGVYYYDGKSFTNFTTREGLLNNEVTNIYEDKKGNIWFSVSGGASCYDGKSFRNYIADGNGMNEDRTGKTFQNRQNNGVGSIMEDKTGKLWFGTSGDACFYDGKTFTVFKNKDGKPFYNVGSIIEDRKGNIWFGGSIIKDRKRISDKGTILTIEAGGLWRYDGSTFTNVTQSGAGAIIEDKKGNIWTTGTVKPNGDWALSRYDAKSLYNKKPTVTEMISKEKMLCGILEASDGSIWFGSMNGVYRYDGKTITDFKSKEGQK